jgi:hypothetical protein
MTAASLHVAPPLSAIQQHMLLSEQLGRAAASHLVCLALRLDGALDAGALDRALASIVARHEILRTGVRPDGGIPAARLRPASWFELAVEQRAAPAPGDQDSLDAILLAETARPLDLADGLPIRARLLSGTGTSVLIVTIHHIAFDEWSRRVFYAELSALYNAFRAGRDLSLPPASSYRDVLAHGEHRPPGEDERLLDYWRRGWLAWPRSSCPRTTPARPGARAGERQSAPASPAMSPRAWPRPPARPAPRWPPRCSRPARSCCVSAPAAMTSPSGPRGRDARRRRPGR